MIAEIDYDLPRWQRAGSGEPWLNLAGGHGRKAFCEDVVHLANKLGPVDLARQEPLAACARAHCTTMPSS